MYQTTCIVLKEKQFNFINYCEEFALLAKLFKNSVIFRCRQLITARNKGFINLTQNEQQVLDEFKLTEDKFKPISDKYYLPSYYHFVYLFTITNNVDYYNNLPMQSSQQIIKKCLADFKGYFNALKDYKKHPTKYTGQPKLPKYIKTNKTSFNITNQDCVIINAQKQKIKELEKYQKENENYKQKYDQLLKENKSLKEQLKNSYEY